MKKYSKCPKCGDFEFDYDENKNLNLIICSICKEELGAVYRPNTPEGIEYKKRFIVIKEYVK